MGKTSYKIATVRRKVLKTPGKMTLLQLPSVPRRRADEKTCAFRKVTFKNTCQMTTYEKNIVRNDMYDKFRGIRISRGSTTSFIRLLRTKLQHY